MVEKQTLYNDKETNEAHYDPMVDKMFINYRNQLLKYTMTTVLLISERDCLLKYVELKMELEKLVNKMINDDYLESLSINKSNFKYLHEKNKHVILLYPPTKASIRSWQSDKGFEIISEFESIGEYLLANSNDSETEGIIALAQGVFFKEEEVQRTFIPSPFKTLATYLGISAVFFYKVGMI